MVQGWRKEGAKDGANAGAQDGAKGGATVPQGLRKGDGRMVLGWRKGAAKTAKGRPQAAQGNDLQL